ncbi:MAG: hypothetical protein ACTSQ2_12035 [Candidatus Heimdallarchaeaceae archaeon]
MAKKKSTEQLDRDIQNLVKKISVIEKFVNVEKNQQDTRVGKLKIQIYMTKNLLRL